MRSNFPPRISPSINPSTVYVNSGSVSPAIFVLSSAVTVIAFLFMSAVAVAWVELN